MSEKISFQGIRCTDVRLNSVWNRILKSYGVPKDSSGYTYDAITVPGGFGLRADFKWIYKKIVALAKAHGTDVVIVSAHDDCAAGGNSNEFLENVERLKDSFSNDSIECTVLGFYLQKSEDKWRPYYFESYHTHVRVIMKHCDLGYEFARERIRWIW